VTKLLFFSLLVACTIRSSSQPSEQIVLINVGHLDREGIAEEISVINGLDPRIIALDLQLEDRHNDSKDAQLALAIANTKAIVTAQVIHNFNGRVFIASTTLVHLCRLKD